MSKKGMFLLSALLCGIISYVQTLTISNKKADMSVDVVQRSLEEYLAQELRDTAVAKELAKILVEDALSWKSSTVKVKEIDTIIAYAFGNRILANGNRLPGLMNEALADVVVKLHKETDAPIYAQWEIAQMIGDRIPSEKIVIINPVLDALANTVYLSTAGVASAIVKQVSDPKELGTIAVIAFEDHLYRCVQISREAGLDAYAPQGYPMPNRYDKDSGQPWTRDRLSYLVADIKARITNRFDKMIA